MEIFTKMIYLVLLLTMILGTIYFVYIIIVRNIAYFLYYGIYFGEEICSVKNKHFKLVIPKDNWARFSSDVLATFIVLSSMSPIIKILEFNYKVDHGKVSILQEQHLEYMLTFFSASTAIISLICLITIYIISFFYKRKLETEELNKELEKNGLQKLQSIKQSKFIKLP